MNKPLPRGVEVRLHLGAHRTATTAVQDTLRSAEDDLARADITALVPWSKGNRADPGVRSVTAKITKAGRRSGLGAWKHRRSAKIALSACLGDKAPKIVILSDENLLGEPFDTTGAALYPDCALRLGALARVLGAVPSRIHLTIRSYDQFFPSVYAMSAIHKTDTPDFDAIRNGFLKFARGWPDVILDIQRIFPASKLSIACYEDDPVERTLAALLDMTLAAKLADRVQPNINASPSLDAMEAASRTHGLSKEALDEVVSEASKAAQFRPFSESETKVLRARYDHDLQHLRRIMPDLSKEASVQ